jgi:uncharacterized protein
VTRRHRIESLLAFYALNVVLLALISHGYLASVPAGTSALGWAETGFAYVANFAMWALAPLLLALPTVLLPAGVTGATAVILFGAFGVFVYADSVVYQLWRFHFNGFVWNLLTTAGAGDSVTAGKSTVLSTAGVIALIFAAQIGGFIWIRKRRLVPVTTFVVAVAALIFIDKAWFDVGHLRDDTEVLRIKNILPLYQTVTIKRFAARVLKMKISNTPKVKVHDRSASLDYPKAPVRLRSDGARPNVLIIALEGARADMFAPDVMPNLFRWGNEHLVLENHYSTGNATRYGIFGMIYGIHGTYWQRALAEQHGPVMIRTLKDAGYSFRVLSCTDMNYPEFRSTAFVDVPDAISDKWEGARVDRDRQMTDEMVRFVKTAKQPYFGFMFYDASHQPYHFPAKDAVFDTGGLTEEINYLRLTHDKSQIPFIRNRYKNSLHYIDALLGPLLDVIDTNTIVVIAGDHGEEFGECGMFGHDSSFDRIQTHALAVAQIPGETPRHITNFTSHLDIVPTVLGFMGADNPLKDYTQGQPLTSRNARPYLFLTTWGSAAMVDSNTTIVFGLEAYNAETIVSDTNNVPLPNQRAAIAERKDRLVNVLQEMRWFTK